MQLPFPYIEASTRYNHLPILGPLSILVFFFIVDLWLWEDASSRVLLLRSSAFIHASQLLIIYHYAFWFTYRKVKADKSVCRLIVSGQRQIQRKWRTRLLLVGELTFNLDGK